MNERKQRDADYMLNGVDLSRVRNRNETRVIECMKEVLEEYPGFSPGMIDIQDIYALALNLLPARYTQEFSIVLREHVDRERIKQAVRQAVERVRDNPTGPEGGS